MKIKRTEVEFKEGLEYFFRTKNNMYPHEAARQYYTPPMFALDVIEYLKNYIDVKFEKPDCNIKCTITNTLESQFPDK